ncbi:MAG: AbrB/MazE/SpoVT family DNA-binding domain-containing protein [Eubacteriales bacterium]
MNTVIQKWGNSNGIRIPKHILNSVSLDVNDIVDISTEDDKIIIQKRNPRKHVTLTERLKKYDGEYVFEECDWCSSVGNEVIK